jgi:hypothetical protein
MSRAPLRVRAPPPYPEHRSVSEHRLRVPSIPQYPSTASVSDHARHVLVRIQPAGGRQAHHARRRAPDPKRPGPSPRTTAGNVPARVAARPAGLWRDVHASGTGRQRIRRRQRFGEMTTEAATWDARLVETGQLALACALGPASGGFADAGWPGRPGAARLAEPFAAIAVGVPSPDRRSGQAASC